MYLLLGWKRIIREKVVQIKMGESEMKYRLIIFDMDGTILDTLEDLTDSTNYALSVNGFKERTIDEVRSFVGNGIHKLIERAVPEGTDEAVVEKVFKDFVPYYKENCAVKTKPYDGITEVIKHLRENGFITAVVSNKAHFAVQELCRDYFPDMFDMAIGEHEEIRRKPYPDAVEEVINKFGVSKEETIYIGDSEVDIQTAVNAGIDKICVEWGFREHDFLLEHGGENFAVTPDDILKFIDKCEN